MLRLIRFTCPEIAVLFTSSFQAFFLLTHTKMKAFSHSKALISAWVNKKKNRSKKMVKKRCFGTCKPDNCGFIYQGTGFVQVTVSCNLKHFKNAESLGKSNQISKIKIELKFLLNRYFFELVNCAVNNCTIYRRYLFL